MVTVEIFPFLLMSVGWIVLMIMCVTAKCVQVTFTAFTRLVMHFCLQIAYTAFAWLALHFYFEIGFSGFTWLALHSCLQIAFTALAPLTPL